jgi:DNA adenine methylase
MKQPITYYGGKQNMVELLLSKMPEHKTYVEPFAGGASLFWFKPRGRVEVLNDLNRNLCIFYECIKNDFDALNKKIQATLHCEATYNRAKMIYRAKKGFSKIDRAWSVWVGAQMSFGSQLFSSTFKFNVNHVDNSHTGVVIKNKRDQFKKMYADRLECVQILNKDALVIIKKFDSEDTFLYIDPPYHNAYQGHYRGYKESDFIALLEVLNQTKSMFLMSCYDSDALRDFIRVNECEWTIEAYTTTVSVNRSQKGKSQKTECLVYNYQIRNLFTL